MCIATATLATVVRITGIRPHPNADRLEILGLWDGISPLVPNDYSTAMNVEVVVGKHYRQGDLGIYIPAGALIPGYLAHQELWLRGRGGATWCAVTEKNMRGIISPGIFAGQYFKNDRDKDGEWTKWSYWCDWWKVGDDVAGYLGIIADLETSA